MTSLTLFLVGFGGRSVVLVLGTLNLIVLARALGPVGRGQYFVFVSLLIVLTTIADLGISQSAVVFGGRHERRAGEIHGLLVRYAILFAALVLAAGGVVLIASGEALLPNIPAAALDALPGRVDRYMLTFPAALRMEVHALFFAVEQTLPFAVGLHRFTELTPADRLTALERIASLGGPGLLIARSIRDLVLLAWYQSPEAWPDIGYEGPMVSEARRPSAYDELRAPPGWTPFGGAS